MTARLACVALLAVGLTGCPSSSEPDGVVVTISGTVTNGGAPAAGALMGIWRPLAAGGRQAVGATQTDANGTYMLATTVATENECDQVTVSVEVRLPSGQAEHESELPALMCGNNTIDFDFQ